MFVSTTLSSSPGFASIVAKLNFILSPAVISIVRGPAAGAGVAVGALLAALGLSAFWPQPARSKTERDETRREGNFMAAKTLGSRNRMQTRTHLSGSRASSYFHGASRIMGILPIEGRAFLE